MEVASSDLNIKVAVLHERVDTIEEDNIKFEKKIDKSLSGIYKKLDRPTWSVVLAITTLATTCGGLITLILSRGLK